MMAKYGSNRGLHLSETALDVERGMTFLRTSDGLSWPNLHAAVIEQRPCERVHAGVPNLWIATPLSEADMYFIVGRREERQIMPAHRVSVLTPYTPITVRQATQICALHVSLKDSLLTEVAGELFDCPPNIEILPAFGTENPCMASLLHAIMVALREPAQHSPLEIEYLARALVTGVLAKHAVQRRKPLFADTGSRLGSRQLQRVLEYIDERLSSDISLNELAAVAGLSRTIFIQRFKRSLNQTPHQYLMCARIRRGQELLAKTSLPMTQIALMCGFADHAHFSTVFRRLLGVTPSAYRRARE